MSEHLLIVTGGSGGLGRAILRAAPDGAVRVDVSRSGPPDDGTDDGIRHVPGDLADPAAIGPLADELASIFAERAWGRITLVHNAGTLEPIGFAGEVDPAAYTTNVLLNSAAGQLLGHRFLALVRRLQIRRELVFLTSGAARTAYPGWSSYGAGKAAIDQWVRTVGAEQTMRGGVRVLAIAPGVVATGMQELIRGTDPHDFPRVERFRQLYAEGQLEEPDAVARSLWAVLDDDSIATGEVVDLRER
jgi:benzil reductase ((S)-benzoin forming)